jgi:hypothetical protein
LGRALADGIEHGLNVGSRACDDAKDLAGRPLLLLSFMQFTGEPGDLGLLASRGTVMAGHLQRIAALSRCRLTVSRFNWFAACSGAPSHRSYPKAQDYADFQRGLQQGFTTGEMGFNDQFALQKS